jgi:hypothetical protein
MKSRLEEGSVEWESVVYAFEIVSLPPNKF